MVDRIRHVRGVGDMTEGAWRVFLVLSFVLAWALIVAVWGLNTARDAKSELHQERVAKNVQAVSRCRLAIDTTMKANRVIGDLRESHAERAEQIRQIRTTDRTKKLYDIHTGIIESELAKAQALKPFPPVTEAQCVALAKRLGVTP